MTTLLGPDRVKGLLVPEIHLYDPPMRLSSSLLVPPEAPGSCAEAGPFQAVQKADLL